MTELGYAEASDLDFEVKFNRNVEDLIVVGKRSIEDSSEVTDLLCNEDAAAT